MALDQNFKHLDIREELENTHMRGRNITFLDDFTRDEIQSLFQAAQMLEPFMRTGTDLLKGKVLYTLFFQPSTRTRCSHENAMHRLGGSVIRRRIRRIIRRSPRMSPLPTVCALRANMRM